MSVAPSYRPVAGGAERTAQWAAVLLGASIPISVALDNVLLGVLVLAWLASANFRDKAAAVRAHPVALAAIALFAVYVAGIAWSDGPPADIGESMRKAARLLLIPLLITVFADAAVRRRAWWGFSAAMLLTLALSYLVWSGALPELRWIKGDPGNPVVFKLQITHNLLMAFAAFAWAVEMRRATTHRSRAAWGIASLLAVANVLLMVQGRTGHLVLLTLLAWLFVAWFRWRGVALGAAALAAMATGAYLTPDSVVHQRAELAVQEFSRWQPDVPSAATSSIGLRLEFYRNTAAVIQRHPVLGVGTGGFPRAYAEQVRGSGRILTGNPHNEYLLVTAQLGAIGLLVLLGLFLTQWRTAARLGGPGERDLARGLVIAIVVASAVSSTLIDHAEGLFYVWMSALLFAAAAPARRSAAATGSGSPGQLATDGHAGGHRPDPA